LGGCWGGRSFNVCSFLRCCLPQLSISHLVSGRRCSPGAQPVQGLPRRAIVPGPWPPLRLCRCCLRWKVFCAPGPGARSAPGPFQATASAGGRALVRALC
jgi:hypothetical protein